MSPFIAVMPIIVLVIACFHCQQEQGSPVDMPHLRLPQSHPVSDSLDTCKTQSNVGTGFSIFRVLPPASQGASALMVEVTTG